MNISFRFPTAPGLPPSCPRYTFFDLPLFKKVVAFSISQDIAFLKWTSLISSSALIALTFVADATLGNFYRLTLGNRRIEQINQSTAAKRKEYEQKRLGTLATYLASGLIIAAAYYSAKNFSSQKSPIDPYNSDALGKKIAIFIGSGASLAFFHELFTSNENSSAQSTLSNQISSTVKKKEEKNYFFSAPVGIDNYQYSPWDIFHIFNNACLNNCWCHAVTQFFFNVSSLKRLLQKDNVLKDVISEYETSQKKAEPLSSEFSDKLRSLVFPSFSPKKHHDSSEAMADLFNRFSSLGSHLPTTCITRYFENGDEKSFPSESQPVIQLPIPKATLQENLDAYFLKTNVEPYPCDETRVTQEKTSFSNIPNDLIINLIRFKEIYETKRIKIPVKDNKPSKDSNSKNPSFTHFFYDLFWGKPPREEKFIEKDILVQTHAKDSKLVEIPLSLELPQNYFSENITRVSHKYSLDAFACHWGTMDCGHWVSYVKSQDGNWYECNDRQVSIINNNQLKKALDAGCYFHFTKETPLD
jgi:hypothetical protein